MSGGVAISRMLGTSLSMMATPRKAWFCIVASRKIMAILSNDRSACGAARHAVATTANLGACRLPRRQRQ